MINRACVLAFVFCSTFIFGQEAALRRVVSVCVLNDAQLESQDNLRITQKAIRGIIRQTSKEYERNAGIALRLVEYHDTFIPVVPPKDHVEELRGACKHGEIVAVFSNHEYYQAEESIFLGWSDESQGVLWNYQVESRRRNSTRFFRWKMLIKTTWHYHHFWWGEQEETPQTTFKHELAHLFGVEHSPDNSDFMYHSSSKTSWSARIREVLRANRGRKWNVASGSVGQLH